MPRESELKSSFNSGEWAALLDGRTDIEGYRSALKLCDNFIPLVQGGLTKRPGTKYIDDPTEASTAKPGILIPFRFSTIQAYMLAFIDGTCHIYTNDYATVATTFAIPYSNDDLDSIQWTQSADKLYLTCPGYQPRVVTRSAPTTWSIDVFESEDGPFRPLNTDEGTKVFADSTTGEVTLEATGPIFTADHVGGLFYIEPEQFAAVKPWVQGEKGDGTSAGLEVGDLRRSEGKTYRCVSVPSLPTGLDYYTTGPAAPTHTYGKAFDGPQDQRTDENNSEYIVGVEWLFLNAGFGILEITAFTSTTEVTARVIRTLPDEVVGGGTDDATFNDVAMDGATSFVLGTGFTSTDKDDYIVKIDDVPVDPVYWYLTSGPITLNFYTAQDSIGEPKSLEVTQFGTGPDEQNFTSLWAFGAWSEEYGWPEVVTFYEDRLTFANNTSQPNTVWRSQTGDYPNFGRSQPRVQSDADDFTLNSREINAIRWLQDDERGLLMGTTGGEWILRPVNPNEALSPLNAEATRSTTIGGAQVRQFRIGKATLFVARDTRTLEEVVYVYESDGFRSSDMSTYNPKITKAGIKQIVYQEHPQNILWLVLTDGSLVAFTYNREQGVLAWQRHTLGGTDVSVIAAGVLPSESSEEDDLWLYVQRTIDGGTKNYIEYLTPIFEDGDAQNDAYFADCGLTYSGTATDTLTGLDHLEGETVTVYGDGAPRGTFTVASGSITLDVEVSTAAVGLAYTAKAQTMRIEAGAGDGTAQGKIKRLSQVVFRVLNTLELKFAESPTADLESVTFTDADNDMDEAVAMFTGDVVENWPGGYDREGYIYIESDAPVPCTILAMMPRVTTQDGG